MIKRAIFAGVLLLVLLGIAAPFIRADQYGEQIKQALERGLNRRVEILGKARFNLFSGPGFTVTKVLIHEHPSSGLEPFAYMEELEARVSLSSLLTGRLDFSMLRFVSVGVNIAKPASGTWNVVQLMEDAKAAHSLPEIQVTDGKIFLKDGDTKSAFFIGAAEVTVTPRNDGLSIRFSGEPARTDRSARAAGLITARGTLTGGKLDLDLELEQSPVDELGGLFRGRRLEYHGTVSSRAKLSGPLSRLTIAGQLNLADVHRWDLTTEHDRSWSVQYKGIVDVASQTVDIATIDSPNKLRLLVSDLRKRPEWALDVAINELSVATLVGVARDLGAPVPERVAIDGKVVGTFLFGAHSAPEGELHLLQGSVRLPDGPELKLADASLLIAGDSIRLAPVDLIGDEGQGAQLEGEYNSATRTLDATISGQGLRFLSRAAVPLVTRFQGGRWTAALQYRQIDSSPAVWSGSFDVRDTTTRVPGLAEALRISTARIEIDGDSMKVRQMRASAAGIEIFGSYAYAPAEARPHRFDFMTPKAAIADIEQLLAPALRRDEGFFARTLRLRRAAVPEWLQHRKAEGVLRIGELTAGELQAHGVRSRVVWDGSVVQLSNLEARIEDGSFKGSGTVDLTKSEPQYKLRGRARNLAWRNGKVDLEGSMESLGSGLDILLSLQGRGTFEARGVVLSPEQVVRTANGEFTLSLGRTGPQFRLSDVAASLGSEHFTGDGSTQADGRLQMELASANRTLRLNVDVAR